MVAWPAAQGAWHTPFKDVAHPRACRTAMLFYYELCKLKDYMDCKDSTDWMPLVAA